MLYVLMMLDTASCFPRWEAVAVGSKQVVREAILDLPNEVDYAVINHTSRCCLHRGRLPDEQARRAAVYAADKAVGLVYA